MKELKGKTKSFLLTVFVTGLFTYSSMLNYVGARPSTNCENYVPNPLTGGDCNAAAGSLSVGVLINRILGFLPVIVTFIIIAMIIKGAVKIALAGEDADKRSAGFKTILNVGIGAVLFYSLWLILFIFEVFLGASLLNFGTTTP